ncbi:EAL domain-containing protein [Roseococcus sp. DSY-14]|uniref:sensor domain-containing protein n=1 Tax=Roseococcus sp. DSY-14 TaxID=3369650 RepID=UPI00387AB83A
MQWLLAATGMALVLALAARAAARWPVGLALLDGAQRCRWRNPRLAGAPAGCGLAALLAPWAPEAEALAARCRRPDFAPPPGGLPAIFLPLPLGWRLLLLGGPPPVLPRLLDGAPIGLWQLDARGRTVFANHRLCALFGGAAPAGLEAAPLRLCGPADGAGPLGLPLGEEREAALALPGRPVRRLVVMAGAAEDGAGHLLSVLDVTPLKAAQERIEHLAEHDPLTGLANRATLAAALEALADDPAGGVLIRVDMDNLRAVNDRHGHAAGDHVLREAAARLRDAVRPSDLVARAGGDEFAVLCFGAPCDEAVHLGDRLREALRLPYGEGLALTASLGLACAPAHGRDAAALLRAADLATLEAKAQGRDALRVFEPALLARAEQRAELREAFVEALAAGELELHVQPQLDHRTGQMEGGEALIRWQSRRLGRWVPPPDILAAAGEAGLLRELDLWVLRTAARLQKSWLGLPGAPARLGVNITSVTLHDPDFARELRAALEECALPPDALEIEIPEDLAVQDLPAVARTMAAIQEIGVPLALDDFGAGHSNLTHVVNLPVQRLKLDRSTVSMLPDDPKAYAILRATMAMARSMGIEVVAEGVETPEQAEALSRLNCHVIQGWLIAKAMPPEDLLRRFAPPPAQVAAG